MSKRQRACDFCRSRKSACRIERAPPCRLCSLSGRSCTFVDGPLPRRQTARASPPRPRDPVEEARLPDVTVEQSDNGSDAPSVAAPPGPEHLADWPFADFNMDLLPDLGLHGMGDPTSELAGLVGFSPMAEVDFMGSLSPQSSASNNPSPMAASSSPGLGSPGIHAEVLGLSGDMDPYVLQFYRFDLRGLFQFKALAVRSVQSTPIPCQFLLSPESLYDARRVETGCAPTDPSPDYTGLREVLQKTVEPSHGERLLDLFRRYIQPHFPLFSQQDWPNPLTTEPHLLASIYVISLPFAVYDDRLNVDTAYDTTLYPNLFLVIKKSLQFYEHCSNITTVQTLFLLALRSSLLSTVTDTAYRWTLVGNLIAHATNVGLHHDPSAWAIPPWEVAHRRRLSSLIFAMDKWLACSCGRPPYLHEDDWLVTSVEPQDQLGTGLGPSDWDQLVHFTTLSCIMGSTLSKL